MEWLVSKNYADDQKSHSHRRAPGTCRWFLQCHEYDEWLAAKGKGMVLFCSGDAGAGKTLLTSAVIGDLQERFQPRSDSKVGIAYVYFRVQPVHSAPVDIAGQRPDNLLKNLLGQIVADLPNTEEAMQPFTHSWKLYNTHVLQQSIRQPSLEDIADAFCLTASWYSRIFVALDALDECPDESRQFLSAIAGARSKLDLRVFATARVGTDVPEFDKAIRIPRVVRASEDDIRTYIASRILEITGVIRSDPGLVQEVGDVISTKSSGMSVNLSNIVR